MGIKRSKKAEEKVGRNLNLLLAGKLPSRKEKVKPDYKKAQKEILKYVKKDIAEREQGIENLSEKYKIPKRFFNDIINSKLADIRIRKSMDNILAKKKEKEEAKKIRDEEAKGKKKQVSEKKLIKKTNEEIREDLKEIVEGDVLDQEEFIKDYSIKTGKTKSVLNKVLRSLINDKKAKEESERVTQSSPSSKQAYHIMTRRGQIEEFWEKQPFYYDSSRIFYLWDKEKFSWVKSDEVDFCNLIYQTLGVDTLDKKEKGEVIEGFKQIGRMHKPEELPKCCVQYKNKIYNPITDEEFEATPKYFSMTPLPWKVGDSEDTPVISKLIKDWMKGQDESWEKSLNEILAYNTTPDKFMQRIISLIGGGANGKTTFEKLNYKFLGEDNCVASELKALSEDKFEPAVLFGKLLCVMGEVSVDDLRNTNMLKKLGGDDLISFQFKGKTPFTAKNTATCMPLTNSMPRTPDKTTGFYRKFHIIDFLNQFKDIDKNPIDEIPDVEFENLARRSLRILKELYKNPHFTNEGNFEEREKRYEERSNPVMKFVETECEEVEGEMVSIREFTNSCNEHLKKNHLRILNSNQIGKILRDEGFIVGARKIDNISTKVIMNLKVKTTQTTQTTQNPTSSPSVNTTSKMGSSGGSSGNLDDFSKKPTTEEKEIMENFSE